MERETPPETPPTLTRRVPNIDTKIFPLPNSLSLLRLSYYDEGKVTHCREVRKAVKSGERKNELHGYPTS